MALTCSQLFGTVEFFQAILREAIPQGCGLAIPFGGFLLIGRDAAAVIAAITERSHATEGGGAAGLAARTPMAAARARTARRGGTFFIAEAGAAVAGSFMAIRGCPTPVPGTSGISKRGGVKLRPHRSLGLC